MPEPRIAARLQDANLLAGVKAAAAASRARLVHWTGPIANDSTLRDSNVVVLETTTPQFALQELQAAQQACPTAQFIVLASAGATADDVRRLFRAGARDVISAPVTQEQIMSAIAEAIGPNCGSTAGGAVVGIVKASGGVGATTLAVNIGGYFANPIHGKKEPKPNPLRVALIDFDVQFGDLALALDIVARKDLTEILRTPKRLDGHFLDGIVERHRSGMHLLSAPPAVAPLEAVDANVALSIVDVAAANYDLVLLQLPMAWTDWTAAMLHRADNLFLVSAASVRGVAGARRTLDAAMEMKVDATKCSLLFNRVQNLMDGRDIVDQARRSLGGSVLGVLSEDPNVREAGDRGRLIWESAPNTRFAKELRQVCAHSAQILEGTRHSHETRRLAR